MTGACEKCPNGELHTRVGLLEQQMARQTAVLENLDRNMGRLVTIGEQQIRLEERQADLSAALKRAFDAIEEASEDCHTAVKGHDERLKALEKDAPINRLASSSIIEGAKKAVGIILLVGLGIILGKNVA